MAVNLPDAGHGHTWVLSLSGDGQRICTGNFQATAAATTTVSNANIPASANIVWFPANAAAGLLVRGATCSVATGNSAGSFVFTVSATGAGKPAGSETFCYIASLENP